MASLRTRKWPLWPRKPSKMPDLTQVLAAVGGLTIAVALAALILALAQASSQDD